MFKFLRALLTAEISTFHKLDVHAGTNSPLYSFCLFFKGLKPSDVISFFDEVNGQVERIKKSFNTSDCAPQVTVSYLGC